MAAEGGDRASGAAPLWAVDGLDAWRITYAGPQAHWSCASFAVGGRFVGALAEAALETGVEPDVDLRPEGVTVQLAATGIAEAEFARRVQRTASRMGLRPDPTAVQTIALTVAHATEVDVRPFWTAALGYRAVGEHGAHDPLRRGPFLAFQRIPRSGRGRTHIDVSVAMEEAPRRIDAALRSAGRLSREDEAPAWWGLASPDNHGVDIVTWPDREARRDA